MLNKNARLLTVSRSIPCILGGGGGSSSGGLPPGGSASRSLGGGVGIHPRGEIEGDQIQAHTQGGNAGGSDPVPHPRGKFSGDQDQTPPTTTAVGDTHPARMHSCFN